MISESTRTKLFLGGCIPIRLALAGLAYYALHKSENSLLTRGLPVVLMIMGAAMLYLYVTASRMDAPEGGADGTWWAPLRAVHGLLYLAAGLGMMFGYAHAWVFLLADALVGLLAFVYHHYIH